jgi:hypothetical protein
MSEQHPTPAPQPPAQPNTFQGAAQSYPGSPGQAPPSGAGAQHPVPPPAKRMHVGAIISIIVGGVLLLGLTFAGGAAVGWWFGAHHGAGWSQNEPAYPGGPNAPDWHDRQMPGQSDESDQPDS